MHSVYVVYINNIFAAAFFHQSDALFYASEKRNANDDVKIKDLMAEFHEG